MMSETFWKIIILKSPESCFGHRSGIFLRKTDVALTLRTKILRHQCNFPCDFSEYIRKFTNTGANVESLAT